jgi:hypothetical protein
VTNRCPQCGSTCGPIVCRFSAVTHTEYLKRQAENRYAEQMTRSDLAQRNTGRPDHDMSASGMPWKTGT